MTTCLILVNMMYIQMQDVLCTHNNKNVLIKKENLANGDILTFTTLPPVVSSKKTMGSKMVDLHSLYGQHNIFNKKGS